MTLTYIRAIPRRRVLRRLTVPLAGLAVLLLACDPSTAGVIDGGSNTVAATASSPSANAGFDVAAEADFLARINAERGPSKPALRMDPALQLAARDHARTLSRDQRLWHQPLQPFLGDWLTVGENVGQGPTVSGLHSAFVASSGHHRNMINGSYTAAGIGVVVDANGILWTSHVFAG